MTWPLASFLILAVALALGFAAYERSRPPAKVLALVATLAALATLGRVAFAPVPNIKPTTDIVLIAGIVLGPSAGFTVGAVAALASNVVFGEGPWTPWQMVAWGLCGLLGAGFVALRGGRLPGRWALAATCAGAAFLYGALVDLSTVTLAGGRDVGSRWLVMFVGSSLPWNIAHAVGNVLFALAFGPALLIALGRFRARFEVTWRPAAAPVASLALALVLLAPVVAGAATPRDYLRRAQHADGGWGSAPRAAASVMFTGWASLGLAAQGVNPADARAASGRSALDFLRPRAARLTDLGDLERTLLVLGAAGEPPRAFGHRDLLGALERRQRPDGSFPGGATLTSFGILALRAGGLPPGDARVRRAAAWLGRQQERDGGWSFYRRGTGSSPDDTGAALQALAAAGRRGALARGARYLARHQDTDGGWALGGGSSNAQSTAYAVQGLVAAGSDPARITRRGRSGLGYLRSITTGAGAVRYSRGSGQTPVWVTAQASLALARRPFPLAPVARRAAPKPVTPRRAAQVPATPAPAARRPHRSHSRAGLAHRKPEPRGLRLPMLVASAGAVSALVLLPVLH